MSAPELHSSIIALVSLASGIASKHPDMGLCQLEKLRGMGIPDEQIATVIEIARHIRDKAAMPELKIETGSCCSTTPSGQSCC